MQAVPVLLTDVSPGTTNAMIAGIAPHSRADGKSTSARVLSEARYASYMDFIEHYNTLETRLYRMSERWMRMFSVDLVPRIAGREHRFIDIVWSNEESGHRCGYLMKLLE